MTSQDLPKPDYAYNLKIIGHSNQGGRPDGVQLMINKGYAITGHMFSNGFSVIDVRDPRTPKPVKYIPAPPNTWNIHLQAHEDLLLVINAKNMFAADEFQDEEQYTKERLVKRWGLQTSKHRGSEIGQQGFRSMILLIQRSRSKFLSCPWRAAAFTDFGIREGHGLMPPFFWMALPTTFS